MPDDTRLSAEVAQLLAGSYVDMDGNPMAFADWAALYGDKPRCVIAHDTFTYPDDPSKANVEVRTMWTGMSMCGELDPFGTVADSGGRLTVLEEYPTKAEALAGHDRWVAAGICGELPPLPAEPDDKYDP
jgi:hypothetical protein